MFVCVLRERERESVRACVCVQRETECVFVCVEKETESVCVWYTVCGERGRVSVCVSKYGGTHPSAYATVLEGLIFKQGSILHRLPSVVTSVERAANIEF